MINSKFDLISSISINERSSWEDKSFITIDIDWVPDEVLLSTISLLKKNNLKATFFVTHQTDILKDIQNDNDFELGIHPNFNFLLNGNFEQGKNIKEVIEFYLKIVPDAKSVRSHSLTHNSIISNEFAKYGLSYECNDFIPYWSNIEIQPWECWNAPLIKVPHFWEDDIELSMGKVITIPGDLNRGLKVYDFHPIHIFLNTDSMSRYNACKKYYHNYPELKNHINDSKEGIKDYFLKIINT